MSWRLAKSLEELRGEINARWPNRDKRSDGSIGDTSHSARKSDHNPNDAGVVRAIDVDADGIPADWLADHVRQRGASGDRRVLQGGYVIFNHRIASEIGGWKWRAYTGSNPHTHHVHISVSRDAGSYDASDGWGVKTAPKIARRRPPVTTTDGLPRHARGSRVLRLSAPLTRGTDVQDLQRWVGAKADGTFGRDTEARVKRWQKSHGLEADGIVGRRTWGSMRVQ
jgi:hypothetical protein